jgi:hypothetical protein
MNSALERWFAWLFIPWPQSAPRRICTVLHLETDRTDARIAIPHSALPAFVGSRFGLRTATSNLPDEFRPRTLVRVALHALMPQALGHSLRPAESAPSSTSKPIGRTLESRYLIQPVPQRAIYRMNSALERWFAWLFMP